MSNGTQDNKSVVTIQRSPAEKWLVGIITTIALGILTFTAKEIKAQHDAQIVTNSALLAANTAIISLAEKVDVTVTDIRDINVRMYEEQRDSRKADAADEAQRVEIKSKLSEVKRAVQEKIPEPKK